MSALLTVEPAAASLAAEVAPEEYLRLLGLPRRRPLAPDLAQRADGARSWYAEQARPRVVARRLAVVAVEPAAVVVQSGERLSSRTLADRLRSGEAGGLVGLGVTAGAEVDAEVDRLWRADRPDEAYFLDRFAAAVAERLVYWAMAWACRLSEREGETVLPHLSPGCGDWEFEEQRSLMSLIASGEDAALVPLSMLDSGMLRPKNSLLAAFGLTRGTVSPSPADACRDCGLDPCRFRRAPRRGAA